MKRFLSDMKKHWRYVIYAGQSDLKTEVANSHLNWLWWIIEPLCFMVIYSLVFGVFFDSQIENRNVFVYIGITMWDFFQRMLKSSVTAVRSNKAIVSKVYLPKYMLILVKMYVNAFKLGICLALLFLMLLVTGVPFTLYMLWLIPIILTMFVFTFGACTFLLHFGVYVDDLSNVVNIVLRMMFYLTGVFFNLQDRLGRFVTAEMAKLIANLNPIACFIGAARNAVMYACLPSYRYLLAWFIAGVILSVLGIMLIYRSENSYVKVI